MRKIISDGVEGSTKKSQNHLLNILKSYALQASDMTILFPCLGLIPVVDSAEIFYCREFRYNDREEPIVIPLSEPEYLYSGSKMTRPTTHYIRYNDDQALLRTSFDRRPYGELRRTYSFGDVRDVRRSRRP